MGLMEKAIFMGTGQMLAEMISYRWIGGGTFAANPISAAKKTNTEVLK